MTWYLVGLRCPECGELHRVSNELQIDGGAHASGTAAGLWPEVLPAAVAGLQGDRVWCPQAGQWVTVGDTGRLVLRWLGR